MNRQEKFIFTSITEVLDEAIVSSYPLGDGITTYPVSEYMIQSIFLKMTGFQEQKLRFIAWEMASNDLEYRYRLLKGEEKLGEYSSFDAKNTIFKSLIKAIKKINPNFTTAKFEKEEIQEYSVEIVKKKFNNTNLATWHQRKYHAVETAEISKIIPINQFLQINVNRQQGGLLESVLKKHYNDLYDRRNSLAHNLNSFKPRFPLFRELVNEGDLDNNYFVWFSILVLIDKIFIELYKVYKEELDNYFEY